jgi:glycosyltransferase involved in cell wall biosynthesis
MRDLDVLESSMKLIWQACPVVELDCVIPFHMRENLPFVRLSRSLKVHWHAGLSAEDLRELYRRASLLFLPFIDATANNGIVEALSCGLPVVSTKVGGIVDYVPENCGVLCSPGSPDEHANAVIRLLKSSEQLAQMSAECRRYSVNELDWKKSAQQFKQSLENLG